MATNNQIPGRRVVVGEKVAASLSQAVAVNGEKSAVTTDVFNSVSAEKEIVLTLQNNDAVNDKPNIKLFVGAWESDYVQPADTAFTVKNFADYAAFQRYFRSVATAITKITMQTDDVSNYDGELIMTSKDPSGKDTEVPFYLSKYKVSLGAGWSPKLEIPFKYMPDATISLRLSNLAKGSKITMYMTIGGVNKSQKLSPISADTI